jgi:glycerol-3-phosphate O-acyltransferase/dihydroxyacetone phosphate acyltransferase
VYGLTSHDGVSLFHRWLDLQDRIIAYNKELKALGLRDYQVPGLDREHYDMDGDTVLREINLFYQIGHLLVLLFIAAIPTVFLNLPALMLSSLYANRRRKKALAKSKVKVKATDVMLTERIMFCIIAVPALWILDGFLLRKFTSLDGFAIALIGLSMPLFSYAGIMFAEAGMVNYKQLRPYMMRLFPSARRRLQELPATRRALQADLRAFIKKLGPTLGEIYYGKKLDWRAIQEQARLASVEAEAGRGSEESKKTN